MADTADHAWGHCLVVLRDPAPAEAAAAAAVRRGGRSRTAVLAHARAQALALAGDRPPPTPPTDTRLPDDLDAAGLAALLAGLRPPLERSVVDLEGRLDRARLARALGMTPAAAAVRAAEIAAAWERDLDPALQCWLGPGDCPELGALLDEQAERATLGGLLACAPPVAAHVEACEVCSDRRRSMVSVRTLQASAPTAPVPRTVRAGATAGRLRLPGPWPAPLDRTPTGGRRRWAAGAAAAVVVLVLVASVLLVTRHHGRHPAGLALASFNALSVDPAARPPNGVVSLRNTSTHALSWQASSSAEWVAVDPTAGRLGPGQSVQLHVSLLAGAPPGGSRASVGIAGSDGSAAQIDAAAPLAGSPDLAATLEGCTVRAQVVDTTDATLTLHYRLGDDPAVHDVAFITATTGETSILPAGPRPLTWWVTAVDRAGGQARTVDQAALLGSC